MKYKIFGKNILINVEDTEIKTILKKELSIYPAIESEQPDVVITFTENISTENNFSSNPSIHQSYPDGFLAIFWGGEILYKKNETFISLNKKKNFLKKFLNTGFRSSIENAGQILHELILVPLIFFDNNKALVHASSMKNIKNNKTILFGGTGGVGKTSLELMLCRDLNYSFISDDIAVVSDDSYVYPNLSYPKIYSYNVVGNMDMRKKLFKNSTLIDKFQWEFLRKLLGPGKVRRAIAPDEIFNSVEKTRNRIDEYYILFKTNTIDKITFESIDYEDAGILTLDIIKNEYHPLFQHVIWHEYNARIMGFEPILRTEDIFSNWLRIYQDIFKNIQPKIIKIPVNIDHKSFLSQMREKFDV